jgi:flagellar hook-associated protein 2
LPAITDTEGFQTRQYNLSAIAGGKTITALAVTNANTHRDIAIRSAAVFDPESVGGGYKPLKAVSTAQDAIIEMEGIDMIRPSNVIDDIIPGVTITARGVSEKPERLEVQSDREGIKDAIISLVGNYNRLMAELNVLLARRVQSSGFETHADDSIVDELTYLGKDEAEEMRKRLGALSGDSTLTQLKANLQRAVTAAYPTDAERDLSMLAHIGISTNGSRETGYNPSRLRGYLDIDPKKLDAAIEQNLPAIKQLFGSNTTGDLLVDTGVAFNLDALSRPFVEIGGIIALKTGSLDSRISQDKRRIDTMDRQLAAKEADLKIQYSRMESAFSRMEQMQSSLDNFSQRNSNR